MANTHLHDLQNYLRNQAEKIREIEAQANVFLHTDNNQEKYNALMKEKAELLSALHDGAKEAAGEDILAAHPEIDARLAKFSQSAKSSIGVNSVFFMSALLYPEDYKDGDNNDLENFIESL